MPPKSWYTYNVSVLHPTIIFSHQSSMDNASKPTIFFLGATGGCTLAALVHTLNAGYPCIALVRTPSKLTNLLNNAGVDSSTLNSLLTIHTGNALHVPTVKATLLIGPGDDKRLPYTIISGLGGAPKFQFNLPPLTIDQPNICQTGAATLVTALSEVYAAHPKLQLSKPLLCFISTGGIHKGDDDVTCIHQMLYHSLLSIPFKDKREMDMIFLGKEGSSNFRSVIAVKPTILTEGQELGEEILRVGKRQKPTVGYTVSKKDVGGWIHRAVVLGDGKGWEEELVTVTY